MSIIKSNIIQGLLLIIIIITLGCSQPIIGKGYLFEPYYRSIISIRQDQTTAKKFGRIHIAAINFDEPLKNDPYLLVTKVIPVFSAFPMAISTQKNRCLGKFLQKGELEKILVSELSKTGMFDKVGLNDTSWDYEIRGRVNVTIETNWHLSGLGIFYFAVIPELIFPMYTSDYVCKAHFDVFSAKGNRFILEKDYHSYDQDDMWLLHTDRDFQLQDIGKNILPTIVKQFIDDLELTLKSQNSGEIKGVIQ